LVEKNAIENYVALRAAYKRDPLTKNVYAAADTSTMSLREREWQIRNALWNQDWATVLTSIQDMPSSSKDTSQWKYWKARALAQLNQTDEATIIYQELAQKQGYFEFLAADQLQSEYQFSHQALIVDPVIQATLKQRFDLRRSRELAVIGMQGRSRTEWRTALNSMSAIEKTQAGYLAKTWDLPTNSIRTAVNSQAGEDIDILYPRAYEKHVFAKAKRYSLNPAWVFGVIRQESLFMPDVKSSANAYGLMQLLPATAKQTAKKIFLKYKNVYKIIRFLQPQDITVVHIEYVPGYQKSPCRQTYG